MRRGAPIFDERTLIIDEGTRSSYNLSAGYRDPAVAMLQGLNRISLIKKEFD